MVTNRLTDTERTIAGLAARGWTNHEIAAYLHLSPKTVEWNLTKVYRSVGVRSRTELAARWPGAHRRNSGETPGESGSTYSAGSAVSLPGSQREEQP